jgi:hypothetical protein
MPAGDWMVEVTFSVGTQLGDGLMDVLSDKFDELDWTVAQPPDGYLSVFGASDDGEESFDAASRVADISKRTLLDLNIDGELERIAICTERWREKEVNDPSLPELLATKDISKVLGVSRQRVLQLRRDHPQFPDPVAHTGAGPLWTRSAIDWFASMWDRRPGRRSDPPEEAADSVIVPMVSRLKSDELGASTTHGTRRERVEA